MNAFFKPIQSDKPILWGYLLSFLLFVVAFLYALFMYSHLPPYIPLFNQMPWGEARITVRAYIFLPIFLSFIIFLINLSASSLLYAKAPLVSRMLAATEFLVSFFAFLFVIRSIQLIV